ncbi:site-specific integrase [Aeromonas encheleia]|uniref:Tyrosine-type recombinase/integrase n=1 Tax=Aeromonas encheleia TaxID=73010 RepID=A0AAE9MCH5_9GAMM|nr:site-specific integrase [Aeromonas encheleia]USV55845.1 tyrosine-type recombinase/integrase [Aeromonas encheleia]
MYLLNRNGIYYYQRVTMCNGRRQTLRKSLKTRDRAKAQLLALQIHFDTGLDTREHNSTVSPEARSVAPDIATPVAHGHIPTCTSSEAVCPSGVESPIPSEHNQTQHDQGSTSVDMLSQYVESYIAEKQLSWAPKETKNQQNYIGTFIEHVGDKCLSDYTKSDAVSFKTWLLGSGKSPTTINKYIQKMSLLFSWLADHTEQTTDIFKGLKLKRVKEVNVRTGYTDIELKQFDAWAKEQEPWRMWIALIGRYHGLRSNEACQLYSDDIEQVNGVWCFNIRATREDQSLKTEASQRLVPIHSKLIDGGFLDFVASRKGGRVFKELPYRNNCYSHLFGQWFSRNRPVNKDFHSLRHTVASKLKAAGIPLQYAAAILGHTNKAISYDRYGGDVPLDKLKEALEVAL